MRVLNYLGMFFFGLIGTLGIARSIDRIIGGSLPMPLHIFMGIGCLMLARRHQLKARKPPAAVSQVEP